MLTAILHDVARAFRRAALPLGCYYTVTIAVPLANGAGESGGAFLDHAVVVAGVPPALVMLVWAFRLAARVFQERCRLSVR